jgi:hypothetical protein
MIHSTNGYYRCSVLKNIIQYYVADCLDDIITFSLKLNYVWYKYQCARPEGKPTPRAEVVMTYWPVILCTPQWQWQWSMMDWK